MGITGSIETSLVGDYMQMESFSVTFLINEDNFVTRETLMEQPSESLGEDFPQP